MNLEAKVSVHADRKTEKPMQNWICDVDSDSLPANEEELDWIW